MEVNYFGAVALTKAFWMHLQRGGKFASFCVACNHQFPAVGRVLCVTSTAGKFATPSIAGMLWPVDVNVDYVPPCSIQRFEIRTGSVQRYLEARGKCRFNFDVAYLLFT